MISGRALVFLLWNGFALWAQQRSVTPCASGEPQTKVFEPVAIPYFVNGAVIDPAATSFIAGRYDVLLLGLWGAKTCTMPLVAGSIPRVVGSDGDPAGSAPTDPTRSSPTVATRAAQSPIPVARESIEVRAEAADSGPVSVGSTVRLAANDIQERSTSTVNDPLRALQLAPGVTSNDDMRSGFMVRGADANRVGFYLDGILLHSPVHKTEDGPGQASVSAVPGDFLESATFYGAGPPVSFSDTDAATVEMRTRDGDRSEFHTSARISTVETEALAEGGFGKAKRGAWLVAARQSYLNYLIQSISTDPSGQFGYRDVSAKFTYDAAPRHQFSALITGGQSGLNLGGMPVPPGYPAETAYNSALGNLSWRYLAGSRFMFTTRIAELADYSRELDTMGHPLIRNLNREHVLKEDALVTVSSSDTLTFGLSLRWLHDSATQPLISSPTAASPYTSGAMMRSSGYVRNTVKLLGGFITLDGGIRWDADSIGGHAIPTVHTTAGIRPWRNGMLHMGWAQYVQFPDLDQVSAFVLPLPIRPERSTHLDANFEQRIGTRGRLTLDLYQRSDRSLSPTADFQFGMPAFAIDLFRLGEISGNAKGAILSFETHAGRLTWNSSYALGASVLRAGGTRLVFPSDADQRHTLSSYLQYDLKPNLHLSTKWRYGSGLPIPGDFTPRDGAVYLGGSLNQMREGSYSRLDARVDRFWKTGKGRIVLHVEVLNALNRNNLRLESATVDNQQTARVLLKFGSLLPILPTASLSFQF